MLKLDAEFCREIGKTVSALPETLPCTARDARTVEPTTAWIKKAVLQRRAAKGDTIKMRVVHDDRGRERG
ncbi:MAG: hypothetical protein QOF14_5806 [Hyphomicrobiales bacterium]|nr:hypothetical protein [Hyphomicrobiales bacterium]